MAGWFILFVIALVLKLASVVTWSWWVVTAPLWFPVVLTFVLALIIGTALVIKRGVA